MVLGVGAAATAGVIAVAAAPAAVTAGVAAAASVAGGASAVATGVTTVAVTAGTTAIGSTLAAATAGVSTASVIGSTISGAFAGVSGPLLAAGPVGWVALGCEGTLSWDCWKPVVHDESSEPSRGRPLREIILDHRMKEAKSIAREDGQLQLELFNIWEEKFVVDFVLVEGELAAHATRC